MEGEWQNTPKGEEREDMEAATRQVDRYLTGSENRTAEQQQIPGVHGSVERLASPPTVVRVYG